MKFHAAHFLSLLMFALTVCWAGVQTSPDKETAERDFGADHFAAGARITLKRPVIGDLIAAGGNVDVDGPVNGDAVVAGGNVRLTANIGQSLYATGGQLRIDGKVGRNMRIAGGQVYLGPQAQVGGNISVGGGQVDIDGNVKGYLQAAGGQITINGAIEGDVLASAGVIELGPESRIGGKLRYTSDKELKRDAAAVVQGGIERLPGDEAGSLYGKAGYGIRRAAGWIWNVGLMVRAAVMVAVFPRFYARVSESIEARFGMSVLVGFIALICVPVAAIILLSTVIGIPLGLLAMGIYLVLLLLGYVSTGIGLGDWALRRFRAAQAERIGWRIGAAVLGIFVIALLVRIPWLGGLVALLALLTGLGALALQAWRFARPAAENHQLRNK